MKPDIRELAILEAGFGEVNQLIDLESISTYDRVIVSGAHLAIIKRDFHELLYAVPIYPLRFSPTSDEECPCCKSLTDYR